MSEKMTNREIAKQLGWIINPKEAENAIAKALDDAEARVEAKYAPLVEAGNAYFAACEIWHDNPSKSNGCKLSDAKHKLSKALAGLKGPVDPKQEVGT